MNRTGVFDHVVIQCTFCGTPFRTVLRYLLDGKTVSCGCARKSLIAEGRKRHGQATSRSGKKQSKTYLAWKNMWQRCTNKNHSQWFAYGGRGILIHPEWGLFENFFRDMGKSPAHRSLDRINNNEGYEMLNCRWATPKQQANNRRERKSNAE